MKGLREALLLMALASLATSMPVRHLATPACAGLALSILLLQRTRLGAHARGSLRFAAAAAWVACALNALLFTPLAAAAVWLAIQSVPLALLALADALRRMARAGRTDDEPWFGAVRLLFGAALVAGCFESGIGFAVQFLCAPVFAFLVLQFRRQFPLERAR